MWVSYELVVGVADEIRTAKRRKTETDTPQVILFVYFGEKVTYLKGSSIRTETLLRTALMVLVS